MEIPHTTIETLDVSWHTCGACWGQRFVLTPARGEGYAKDACHHCLGIGERMSVRAPLTGGDT